MGAVKRKEAPVNGIKEVKKQKLVVGKPENTKRALKNVNRADEDEDEFGGFSGDSEDEGVETGDRINSTAQKEAPKAKSATSIGPKQFKVETTSSAEAHAKQRALAKERKASKPSADAIQRSKKIWERLRRKSHVPTEERKELVAELFDIITGRVRDFVFKHDSVRVIQCALKYANQDQRKIIVQELKGDIKTLAESRYGKFLVAKMVQEGDAELKNAIVPEFYGHVRRLINHPEASWIVDDIYRQIANQQQKATMLREWYGAEFALFHRKPDAKVAAVAAHDDTADLKKILEKNPEKRKPILQYLLQMINSLVQKKMTGFTMLHDAMLQYFLALTPAGEEHTEFLEILKGDIDAKTEGGGGDLFRNLAFTKSGSRLVCLALAYSSSKDRKMIIKVFKDTIEMMAYDTYGKIILVVGMDVPDDTKMSSRSILSELLGQHLEDETQRLDRLEQIVTNLNARLPILYPMAGMAKWLVNDADKAILEEVHEIRKMSSKKAPQVRRTELLEYLSTPLLDFVAKRTSSLVQSSLGCQFITETMLESNGGLKAEAKKLVAALAAGNPSADLHIAKDKAAGRMLKTLVEGGKFDPATKSMKLVNPPVRFAEDLHPVIKDWIVDWACSPSSFVVVGLLESEVVPQDVKTDVLAKLKKGKKKVEVAAEGDSGGDGKGNGHAKKKNKVEGGGKGNAGARLLLGKIT